MPQGVEHLYNAKECDNIEECDEASDAARR